jgi:hypothetical protein
MVGRTFSEIVHVLNQGGYGHDIFILNSPEIQFVNQGKKMDTEKLKSCILKLSLKSCNSTVTTLVVLKARRNATFRVHNSKNVNDQGKMQKKAITEKDSQNNLEQRFLAKK